MSTNQAAPLRGTHSPSFLSPETNQSFAATGRYGPYTKEHLVILDKIVNLRLRLRGRKPRWWWPRDRRPLEEKFAGLWSNPNGYWSPEDVARGGVEIPVRE